MPREKLSPELKSAIKALTSLEKEKLIFRLLPSNEILVRQLEYRLLEEENTQEERRDIVRENIAIVIQDLPSKYFSSLYLLKVIRELSARITRHTTITRDKYGEIDLNVFLLNQVFEKYEVHLQKEDLWTSEKTDTYIVKKAIKLQKLLAKLHEDYLVDFEDDMKKLGLYIDANPSMKRKCISLELNLASLKKGVLPEDENT